MLVLPTEKHIAKTDNPRFMILFGKPKSGKTTFAASVENNLIVDLEGGTEYMDALSIQARTVADLGNIVKAIKEKIKENGGRPYKYITIDSGTVLEDIAHGYALTIYQQTPMAQLKDGTLYSDDILKLPKGAGYMYLREAFEKLYKIFFDLADHIILICHCKDSIIDKDGKEMSEMSMDLTGKIARQTASKADAIGYVYRKENKTIFNFKTNGDLIAGARPKHLREQEIVVAESDDDGNVTVFPERIYLPENQN